MTPEAKRMISELRREFYSLFAVAMNVPVKITSESYSSNSPIASWVDAHKRLNYVNIYAHTAPDIFVPKRPFLLRVAVNKSAGTITTVRHGQECFGLNKDWNFELTLLPEEILDFLPWLVNLVKAYDKGLPSLVQEPPHPFGFKKCNTLLFNDAWTESAWLIASKVY